MQTKLASFKLGKESADRVILKEYADMPNDDRVQVLDVPAAVRDAVDARNILSQLGPFQWKNCHHHCANNRFEYCIPFT